MYKRYEISEFIFYYFYFFAFLAVVALCHRLFKLARTDWIPLRSLVEVLTITDKDFRGLPKRKSLWFIASLT